MWSVASHFTSNLTQVEQISPLTHNIRLPTNFFFPTNKHPQHPQNPNTYNNSNHDTQYNTHSHTNMATNNSSLSSVSSSSASPTSSHRQNARTTSESHNDPAASTAVTTGIAMSTMAPAQPQATVNIDTRGSRELRLAIALRSQRVEDHPGNPFVDSVLGQLQEAFEAQCQVDDAGIAITEEAQLQQRKLECVKAGLYALRRIHTAWSKYPAVGGRLEGAQIKVVDFRYTAHSAVVDKPDDQLADQYCRIMASSVDPIGIEDESAPHAQPRVNNCFPGIKKQFMALFHLMDPKDLKSYMFDEDVLSDDEAEPRSYQLQANLATLHPPSTGAYLMSSRGLTEAVEFEDDDNQHIYVTGAVLKTKAEKHADLKVQVAKAKKIEQAEAVQARVKASAAKATATGKGKGKARKSDTPPVESEEEEEVVVDTPAKKPAAKKIAATKVKGGKRSALSEMHEEYNEDDAATTKPPTKTSTRASRKRSSRRC
jgi:hypothetical protein